MRHFYPGMGATNEMYYGPWRDLEDTVFHDWPRSNGETTIPDLAQRLILEHDIHKGDTIVGTSLGGIAACEIANQIELNRLVLIASAVRKEEINYLLKVLYPFIDLAPLPFLQLSAGSLPGDLCDMFSKGDPKFIRNMCKAIFDWNGLQAKVDLIRIHGTRDRVIPMPEGVSNRIDGGHLIVMTHASECIERVLFQ